MKTRILCTIALLCCLSLQAQIAYGEIRGLIRNSELENVPYATIKILQGDHLVGGTQTDESGHYKYKPLVAGFYELVVLEQGHLTQRVNSIEVRAGEATYVDVKLKVNTLGEVVVEAPPIDYSNSGVDATMYKFESISGAELRENAGFVSGDLNSAITAITSDVVESAGGELHFRGGRSTASASFIDGVRTYGSTSVPGVAIENLTVFTGGVPACYGDLTSGMVMITTKSYFSGIREKNLRNAAYRERREREKRQQQEKEQEEKRRQEIEAEKASGS